MGGKKNGDEDDLGVGFMERGMMKSGEMCVVEGEKEIEWLGEGMEGMFGMVKEVLGERKDDKFVKVYRGIEKYEGM